MKMLLGVKVPPSLALQDVFVGFKMMNDSR